MACLCGANIASAELVGLDVWSRPLPPTSPNGAAYLTMHNHGIHPDRLLAARSDIADTLELPMHLMEHGLMKMIQVDAVEVPPDTSVVFQPGGYHLMLLGLKRPLVQGGVFPGADF